MCGAREGGTTLAALSHPILVPFLRVIFSPELLTKATATHLVPSFTVVYDSNCMHIMEGANVLHGFSSNI